MRRMRSAWGGSRYDSLEQNIYEVTMQRSRAVTALATESVFRVSHVLQVREERNKLRCVCVQPHSTEASGSTASAAKANLSVISAVGEGQGDSKHLTTTESARPAHV